MPLPTDLMDRQEFLKQKEDLDYKKQLEEKARLEALQKLRDQGLGQQMNGGYANAPSLNKRRFGPYELTTSIDHESADGDERKFSHLINSIKKVGPEHSLKDAEALAKDLKDINKPVDPNMIKGIMDLNDENEYLQSLYRMAEGKQSLWNK